MIIINTIFCVINIFYNKNKKKINKYLNYNSFISFEFNIF